MSTMSLALDRARRLHGSSPAVVDPEGDFTWAAHVDRVARAADMLAGQGVGTGERFAILSRNTRRHFELLHAGYWSGAVPVPVNCRLAPPEIAFILEDSGCRVLFVDPPFADLLEAPELAPWREDAVEIGAASDRLIDGADPVPRHDAAADEDAILLYTGGTTGRSKGVRLNHGNVVANGLQVGLAFSFTAADTFLHAAPMFHSADLLGTATTLMGGSHAFLPAFSPENLLGTLADSRATFTMLAPTMIIMTLQQADPAAHDLGALRAIFYGSAPMAVEWIEKTMQSFAGVELAQGYGLTETAPILTIMDSATHVAALKAGNTERLKSAGKPVVGVELRLLDDAGNAVDEGEVAVRGPNVSQGYLNLPEVNAETFRGGWFRTGDIGRLDDEGFLYLLDRKKDMIVTGGENVYSSEVEAAIYQHPDIAETAVIGVPDETYGEMVVAAVVAQPGRELDPTALTEHCRARIGGYKIPRRIEVLEAMPKNAMGKILKTELRRLLSE